MKIGLIAAMDKEVKLLKPLLSNLTEQQVEGNTIYRGDIDGHPTALLQCGIGKVNSALSTLALIESFAPDIVINSGVAGGADRSMHVLDLLVATEVAYHDVWCGPGTQVGAAYGFDVILSPDSHLTETARQVLGTDKVRYGLICSGDRFISTEEEVRSIKADFPQVLAVDMESASIAQVCTLKHVPFGIVRVISDTPGADDNISQYENFWADAPQKTFDALRRLLAAL